MLKWLLCDTKAASYDPNAFLAWELGQTVPWLLLRPVCSRVNSHQLNPDQHDIVFEGEIPSHLFPSQVYSDSPESLPDQASAGQTGGAGREGHLRKWPNPPAKTSDGGASQIPPLSPHQEVLTTSQHNTRQCKKRNQKHVHVLNTQDAVLILFVVFLHHFLIIRCFVRQLMT